MILLDFSSSYIELALPWRFWDHIRFHSDCGLSKLQIHSSSLTSFGVK